MLRALSTCFCGGLGTFSLPANRTVFLGVLAADRGVLEIWDLPNLIKNIILMQCILRHEKSNKKSEKGVLESETFFKAI